MSPVAPPPLYVVTGASRGIGAAVARRLVAEGAAVIGVARDGAALALLERELGERFAAHPGDVRREEDADALARAVAARGDALAGLVHAAGVLLPGTLEELPPEQARRTFETNVLGPLLVTRALLPRLVRPPGATVVNVASIAPTVAQPGLGVYAASKAALLALGDAWREELRDRGVRVVSLMPGSTATGMVVREGEDASWMLDPDDVADAVVFAVSRPARALVSRLEVRPARRRPPT